LRPEDAWALAEREAAGAPIYIAESQCYGGDDSLDVARMRDGIRAGAFGRPVQWRLGAMTRYRPQEWCDDLAIGGGAFLEGGSHVLTTARVLFGEAVHWQGSVRCFSGGTGPDTGTILVDYEHGDAVSLSIGWGTEGCFGGECAPLHTGGALIGPRTCQSWWNGDNHAAMWRHLMQCIAAGADPVAMVAQAAGAVQDVWNCYEAAGVTL
jgi:predicted dehydrogenase